VRKQPLLIDVVVLAGAIVIALLVALIVAALGMHVPGATDRAIGAFLGISGGLTVLLGALVLGVISRVRQFGLRQQIAIALCGGALVALLNVLVTAWLMFISPHDLGLLLLLLLFSLLVSLSFAAVISRALVGSLRELVGAARRLAGGDLTVRVAVAGRGELPRTGARLQQHGGAAASSLPARTRPGHGPALARRQRFPRSTQPARLAARRGGGVAGGEPAG